MHYLLGSGILKWCAGFDYLLSNAVGAKINAAAGLPVLPAIWGTYAKLSDLLCSRPGLRAHSGVYVPPLSGLQTPA